MSNALVITPMKSLNIKNLDQKKYFARNVRRKVAANAKIFEA